MCLVKHIATQDTRYVHPVSALQVIHALEIGEAHIDRRGFSGSFALRAEFVAPRFVAVGFENCDLAGELLLVEIGHTRGSMQAA